LPAASPAAEEWKPTRPVELVVAAGPGGSLDQVARTLGSILEKQGSVKSLVVSNRPSGAGRVAMSVLQQHEGDGHYLASWAAQWLTNYIIGDWDIGPDHYTMPAILFNEYVALAVRNESPIRDARDLVERLRKDPTSVSIGVATALGNHIHIGAAKPLQAAGIDIAKLTIVPFKSSAETLMSAMGGHLDVVAATTPNLVAQLQAGKIRVIAVSSPERLGGVFAGVPTWKEQGIDAEYASTQGIMGPKGLSKAQMDFWADALRKAVETPEWRAFVERNQWKPRFIEGDAAKKYLEEELVDLRTVLGAMKMAKQ
jgi:putative tricarboxylic transport membrane protein